MSSIEEEKLLSPEAVIRNELLKFKAHVVFLKEQLEKSSNSNRKFKKSSSAVKLRAIMVPFLEIYGDDFPKPKSLKALKDCMAHIEYVVNSLRPSTMKGTVDQVLEQLYKKAAAFPVLDFEMAMFHEAVISCLGQRRYWNKVLEYCGVVFFSDYRERPMLNPSLAVEVFQALLDAPLLHTKMVGLFYYTALVHQGHISCALKISKRFKRNGKALWLNAASMSAKSIHKNFWEAKAQFDKKDFLDASHSFHNCVRLQEMTSPARALLTLCVANCHERMDDLDRTVLNLDIALILFPHLIVALRQKARYLVKMGDFQGVLSTVYQLLEYKDRPKLPKEWPQHFFSGDEAWWKRVEILRDDLVKRISPQVGDETEQKDSSEE